VTKNTLEEAAAAMQATSTAQWSDQEKRMLQDFLGLGHEEVEALLRWVVSIRGNSALNAEPESQPTINPALWSR
jgi:hypothetical protein